MLPMPSTVTYPGIKLNIPVYVGNLPQLEVEFEFGLAAIFLQSLGPLFVMQISRRTSTSDCKKVVTSSGLVAVASKTDIVYFSSAQVVEFFTKLPETQRWHFCQLDLSFYFLCSRQYN